MTLDRESPPTLTSHNRFAIPIPVHTIQAHLDKRLHLIPVDLVRYPRHAASHSVWQSRSPSRGQSQEQSRGLVATHPAVAQSHCQARTSWMVGVRMTCSTPIAFPRQLTLATTGKRMRKGRKEGRRLSLVLHSLAGPCLICHLGSPPLAASVISVCRWARAHTVQGPSRRFAHHVVQGDQT
jgi:hypothetical protein